MEDYYVQIVYHILIPTDHEQYDESWVVALVLEDMGEFLLLVIMCKLINVQCFHNMLCCSSSSGVMWTSTTWYFTIFGPKGMHCGLVIRWWVARVTEA